MCRTGRRWVAGKQTQATRKEPNHGGFPRRKPLPVSSSLWGERRVDLHSIRSQRRMHPEVHRHCCNDSPSEMPHQVQKSCVPPPPPAFHVRKKKKKKMTGEDRWQQAQFGFLMVAAGPSPQRLCYSLLLGFLVCVRVMPVSACAPVPFSSLRRWHLTKCGAPGGEFAWISFSVGPLYTHTRGRGFK